MYRKKNLFTRVTNLTFKPDQIKALMGKTFDLYQKELRGEKEDEEEIQEEETKMQARSEELENKKKFYTWLDNTIQNWAGFNWVKEKNKINLANIINTL
jgi:hypothetical protein